MTALGQTTELCTVGEGGGGNFSFLRKYKSMIVNNPGISHQKLKSLAALVL